MKLEYVKRLKELGVWKPEHPCLYAASYGCKPVEECNGYDGCEFPTLSQLLEEVEKRAPAGRIDHEFTRFTLSQLLEEVEKRAPAGRIDHEFTRFPYHWGYLHRRCGDPYPDYFSGIGETKSDAVALALIEIVEGEKNT